MVQSTAQIRDLQNPPADTVSDLAFTKLHNLMAVSSWDGSLITYDPSNTFGAQTSSVNVGKPLLSCCFSGESPATVFAGSPDGSLQMIDIQTNQFSSFQAHQEGIRSIRYYQNMLVTGSWDKTIKFWDIRSSKMALSLDLQGKVYAMDLARDLLAVGLSGNTVVYSDLRALDKKQTFTPKLNFMIKSIACANDNETFSIGGIEGKCDVYNISNPAKRIVFRCHRVNGKIYPVNSVSYHPASSGMMATAGGDGSLVFFETNSRTKLFYHVESNPITAAKFSENGQYYVFATGNDWSTGYQPVFKPVNIKVVQVNTTGVKL